MILVTEPVFPLEDPVIVDYVGQLLAVVPSHAHVSYVVDVHPVNRDREIEFRLLELFCYLEARQVTRNLRRFVNNENLRDTLNLKQKLGSLPGFASHCTILKPSIILRRLRGSKLVHHQGCLLHQLLVEGAPELIFFKIFG